MTTFYRVSWVAPDWQELEPHESGHPLHIPLGRQGAGRFDAPHLYYALYLSRVPQGAVGEILGDLNEWPNALWSQTLTNDAGTELARHLVTVETDRSFIDLDDGAKLDKLGWKPSDVVNRDRAKTQQLAEACWHDRAKRGDGGFSWWSFQHPAWTVAMAWSDAANQPDYSDIRITDATKLDADSTAVKTASSILGRPLT